MTVEEIAEVLGISVRSVFRIQDRALAKIAASLTEDDMEGIRELLQESEVDETMFGVMTDAMYQSSFDFEDDGLGDFWKEENVSEQ